MLNSKLIWFYLKYLCPVLGDAAKYGRLRLKNIYIQQLPIRPINFSDPADKARHDKMVSLVEQMLELNLKLANIKLAHERTALERQIAATDRQIDVLVYELYGLTEEEIKIIESS